MKKMILWIVVFVLSAGLVGATGVDYGKLTVDNVPSMKAIVKEMTQASTSGDLNTKEELRRIHLSHLLPTVQLSYGEDSRPQYEYGYNTLSNQYTYGGGSYGSSSKDYTKVQDDWYNTGTSSTYAPEWYVDVEWELGKLITDKEEVYLYYVNARNSYYRTGTVENTVDVYRDLVSLLLEKKDAGSDPSLTADIYASAAELDYLTGGYLSKIIRELPDESVAVQKTEPAKVETAVSEPAVRKPIKRIENKEPEAEKEQGSIFDMMLDDEE